MRKITADLFISLDGVVEAPLPSARACGCSTRALNLVYGPAESPGSATYDNAKVHLPQSDA